ncbi:MAG: cob(I)yrinic acid a,c-diamide adenosyltransferase [Actinomycetota bacterium]
MSEPPRDAPKRAPEKVSSLVLVNTGEGKGKSTAAFGTAMRAAGRGWNVCVIQFLKSDRWKTGEEQAARRLGIDWWTLGDGFTWDSEDMEQTEAVARAAWEAAREKIAGGEHRLVVLDEITYAVNWGWIGEAAVVEAIRSRPADVSVIVTGRDASAAIVALADTVTEMVKRKHAFDAGITALAGIEF